MMKQTRLYGVWYKSTKFDYEKWYTKNDGACIFSPDKRIVLATVIALKSRGVDVSVREVGDDSCPVEDSGEREDA